MTEKEWRHRFVQELVTILRRTTGLSQSKSYELAFEDEDSFWRDFASFDSPESAAMTAYNRMREPSNA